MLRALPLPKALEVPAKPIDGEPPWANFPLIGLLYQIDFASLPPILKTRLCISLEASNWPSELAAGVRGEKVKVEFGASLPFELRYHSARSGMWLEIRPRVSRISRVLVGVDLVTYEAGAVGKPFCAPWHLPPDAFGSYGLVRHNVREFSTAVMLQPTGKTWVIKQWIMDDEASPSRSY